MTDSSYPLVPSPGGTGNAAPGQWPGMTMGQILDRVFRLLRAHLKMYVGLALVPALAVLCSIAVLVGLAALLILPHLHDRPGLPDLWSLLLLVPVAVLLYVGVFVVYSLYAAAASYAAVRTNQGEAVTGAEAWAVALKGGARYTWLVFLFVLIIGGPVYVILGVFGGMFAMVALASAHNGVAPLAFLAMGPLFTLLNLCAQVYMVFMFLRFGLAIPACVMEDLPAVPSLRRSAALTQGGKGRFFVVLLVMYAASFVLILACEMILFLVGGVGVFAATLIHVSLHSPALLFFFAPLGLALVIVVILALVSLPYAGYSTALGVVYCDQRQRVDGGSALPEAGRPA
jgi:hypothetical protein